MDSEMHSKQPSPEYQRWERMNDQVDIDDRIIPDEDEEACTIIPLWRGNNSCL